eukprot:6211152-Pleurochrysis_carterae.AAC.1
MTHQTPHTVPVKRTFHPHYGVETTSTIVLGHNFVLRVSGRSSRYKGHARRVADLAGHGQVLLKYNGRIDPFSCTYTQPSTWRSKVTSIAYHHGGRYRALKYKSSKSSQTSLYNERARAELRNESATQPSMLFMGGCRKRKLASAVFAMADANLPNHARLQRSVSGHVQ